MSPENMADILRTSPKKVQNLRSELIRLGWIRAEKNKYGEIKSVESMPLEFIPVFPPQVDSVPSTGGYSIPPQVETKTEVLPLSDTQINTQIQMRVFGEKDNCSQPSAAHCTPKEELPFGEEITSKSVRPDLEHGQADAERKRVYAVAGAVRKRLGLQGKVNPQYKQLIKNWLDAGFTEDDIVEANCMMIEANDGYHETLTPLGRLSSNSMDWYQEQRNKDRPIYTVTPEEEEKYSGPVYPVDERGFIIRGDRHDF